jgi:hypothetical protein
MLLKDIPAEPRPFRNSNNNNNNNNNFMKTATSQQNRRLIRESSVMEYPPIAENPKSPL